LILEANDVTKRFGRRWVLKGATFTVERGEIAAIVGENGSGKTTLLRIIAGLLPATTGGVRVSGLIGYCPQELLVFDSLTVQENLAYFADAYGLGDGRGKGGWREEASALLERLRFAEHRDEPVARLSQGTKQKLNLCLALLHSPELLILDEPYSGFDWETYLHFWDYARELKVKGTSILLVSHFIFDPSRCDRVHELKEGHLRCT